MTAVFKLLQTKLSIEVPPAISGFQSSQERRFAEFWPYCAARSDIIA